MTRSVSAAARSTAREHRLLAAHALDHRVDFGLRDLDHGPRDRQAVEGIEPDLGQHLEHRRVTQLGTGRDLQRLDARIAGRAQLLLRHRLDEALLHQVGDRFRMHLAFVLLAHDRHRHLAGPETLEPRRARQVLEPLVHAAGHELAGHRDLEPPLQAIGRN